MRSPDLKNTWGRCCQIRGQKNFNQKNIILFWSAMKKMIVWWFPFQFFFWFEAAMPWRLKIHGQAIASTIFGRMTSKFHKIILWQWQINFIIAFDSYIDFVKFWKPPFSRIPVFHYIRFWTTYLIKDIRFGQTYPPWYTMQLIYLSLLGSCKI